jgi:hypothetical protein
MKTPRPLISTYFLVLCIIAIGVSATFSECAANEDVGYTTFVPGNASQFSISFEYPSVWQWSIEERALTTPPLHTLTMPGYSQHPYGDITISVQIFETDGIATEYAHKRIIDYTNYVSRFDPFFIVENIIIGDHHAKRIIAEYPPDKAFNEKEPSIVERIFLVVENRFYWFSLGVANSHRNGELGRGFDHIIETIKVIKNPSVP